MTDLQSMPADPIPATSSNDDGGPWHFAVNGQRYGPVALAEVETQIIRGAMASTDFVWRSGMPQWTPAMQIPQFERAIGIASRQIQYGGYVSPAPAQPGIGDSASMRMLLPVGRSGWAIASGYLGLLSVIPLVGVFAIITGILAIHEIRVKRGTHGMGRAIFGIAAGGLGTLFWVGIIFRRAF